MNATLNGGQALCFTEGKNQSPCPLDQRFISRDSSRAYSIELDLANMTSEVIRCGSELDAALLLNSMQLD